MIPFTFMKQRGTPEEPEEYDDSPFALPISTGSLGRSYADPAPPKWWQWFREVEIQLEHRNFPVGHTIEVSRPEEGTFAPAPAYDDDWGASEDGTNVFLTGVNFTVDVLYDGGLEADIEPFLEDHINGVSYDPQFGPSTIDDPDEGGILEGTVFIRPVPDTTINIRNALDNIVATFTITPAFVNNDCMQPVDPLDGGNPSEPSDRSIRITYDDAEEEFTLQTPSNWNL